jgi:hypothetical protein
MTACKRHKPEKANQQGQTNLSPSRADHAAKQPNSSTGCERQFTRTLRGLGH